MPTATYQMSYYIVVVALDDGQETFARWGTRLGPALFTVQAEAQLYGKENYGRGKDRRAWRVEKMTVTFETEPCLAPSPTT